jgi:hypothetical protein
MKKKQARRFRVWTVLMEAEVPLAREIASTPRRKRATALFGSSPPSPRTSSQTDRRF